jgi:uncharacterized membrane protein YhaH (DUF805 family)
MSIWIWILIVFIVLVVIYFFTKSKDNDYGMNRSSGGILDKVKKACGACLHKKKEW